MKLTKLIILVITLCICSMFGAKAAYNGTPKTPKQISNENYASYGFTADTYLAYEGWYGIRTAEELYGFAALVNSSNNKYVKINGVLTADIVVNENVLNADGELNETPTYSWTPIGGKTYAFGRNFDGQGHTISGLYHNSPDSDFVGMFGYADIRNSNSNKIEILNVRLIDSYFKGNNCVGGICGGACISVWIKNCYDGSTVIGNGNKVGGICGELINSAHVINCYNTGKVIGNDYGVGGICGYIFSAEITDCCNTGMVMGGSYGVGGICGINGNPDYFEINNCYYLAGCAIDGDNVMQYGVGNEVQGLTTADVRGKTFSKMVYNGTPVTPKRITSENYTTYGFTSTTYSAYEGWYGIRTAEELYGFAALVNSSDNTYVEINGVLTADLVINENVLNAEGEPNDTPTHIWTPIGTYSNRFAGKFDGQGHTISGLFFLNTTNADYPSGGNNIGLFGYAEGTSNNNMAEISNVGVVDSYLHGYDGVGGICGRNFFHNKFEPLTAVTKCFNTGLVIGDCYVGGICGQSSCSNITNCYNTGTIKCNEAYVGGICGGINMSTVANSYDIGMINGGKSHVGSVFGGEGYQSTITNCYYLAGCAKDERGTTHNGIGNGAINGKPIPDNRNKTQGATAEGFASGKIAYLLNGSISEGDLAWYQTLFSDSSPVLDYTHNRVTGYINDVDNVITVNGDLIIASNYEITENKTLIIGESASVTIAEGAKLINNGTITNNGTFTNNGTLANNGIISGNNLAGSGNFIYTQLADNEVTLSENNYMYKGSPFTVEDGLVCEFATHTICGRKFSFGGSASYTTNCNVGPATVTWTNVDGSTISRTFTITPNTNVKVSITGNSNTVTYNTEEQSISGYTVDIEDATGVYTENNFSFSGSAAASGTIAGTYSMGLSADDFSNTNDNFAEVQFVVADGVLTISKAENAPNMPTAIETYYINTKRVALPDNWQWAEDIDLEKGDNTATAEYVGDDADNYENVSVEVVVTRTDCPHNEGHTTINTAEPTCAEEGYTGDHLCNICNEIFEQGEVIPVNAHSYNSTITAPTCTAVGYTSHTCSVCNHTYNSDTIPANGHKPDSVVFENIVAATCTMAGSQDSVVYCSVCQTELSRNALVISAKGHSYSTNDVAPTCTAIGYTTHICSVCNHTFNSDTVPAKGHTAVVDSAVAATATSEGLTEGSHCSVCGETILAQVVIPALGEQGGDDNQGETENEGENGNQGGNEGQEGTEPEGENEPEGGNENGNENQGGNNEGNGNESGNENQGGEIIEPATAVADDAASAVNIFAHHNIIVVENANAEIRVYNIMGGLVATANETNAEIRINITGVYVVRVGNTTKRVMISD